MLATTSARAVACGKQRVVTEFVVEWTVTRCSRMKTKVEDAKGALERFPRTIGVSRTHLKTVECSSKTQPLFPLPSRRTPKHAAMMSRSSAATIAALGLVLATAHAEKYLACCDSAHEHENAWFGKLLPNITGPDNEGFTP
eukprot:scaffold3374_cov153-Pinguiococcus_pyrenoidosus.AAC.1